MPSPGNKGMPLSFFCKSNLSRFLTLKWECVLKMETGGLQVFILWPGKQMGERIWFCFFFKWLALGIFPKYVSMTQEGWRR